MVEWVIRGFFRIRRGRIYCMERQRSLAPGEAWFVDNDLNFSEQTLDTFHDTVQIFCITRSRLFAIDGVVHRQVGILVESSRRRELSITQVNVAIELVRDYSLIRAIRLVSQSANFSGAVEFAQTSFRLTFSY